MYFQVFIGQLKSFYRGNNIQNYAIQIIPARIFAIFLQKSYNFTPPHEKYFLTAFFDGIFRWHFHRKHACFKGRELRGFEHSQTT